MLQLDGIEWKTGNLGKKVLILEPITESDHLKYIHRLNTAINHKKFDQIFDVVPAYTSIAIFFVGDEENIINYLEGLNFSGIETNKNIIHRVEVDYEKGMDWERVISDLGLSQSEVIERHSTPIYKIAMIGFLPGFIFLEGLDLELKIPRLEAPRTKVPSGSVGIGGSQTGIYCLESPGGWNIIGRTECSFFDIKNDPPISLKPGDLLTFKPKID